MANIAEPLELIGILRLELNMGKSVKSALHSALHRSSTDFSEQISAWLITRTKSIEATPPEFKSEVRIQFLRVMELGLRGWPVFDSLAELEEQMIEICEEDIQSQLDKLPLLMAMPMIFCFLPAFLILILGPVLHAFTL